MVCASAIWLEPSTSHQQPVHHHQQGGDSERPIRSDGSLSAERFTMKEQLESVKSTLNQLVHHSGTSSPAPAAAAAQAAQPPAMQLTSSSPLENLMSEIASR